VASLERSSTTITSTGWYAVARIEPTQRSMFTASSRAGTMTEISGPVGCGG